MSSAFNPNKSCVSDSYTFTVNWQWKNHWQENVLLVPHHITITKGIWIKSDNGPKPNPNPKLTQKTNPNPTPILTLTLTQTKPIKRTMYRRKVDVDMLNAIKSVRWLTFRALAFHQSKELFVLIVIFLLWRRAITLETSANALFTAFSISTSTLRWSIARFTATPTQTKTSSHRD